MNIKKTIGMIASKVKWGVLSVALFPTRILADVSTAGGVDIFSADYSPVTSEFIALFFKLILVPIVIGLFVAVIIPSQKAKEKAWGFVVSAVLGFFIMYTIHAGVFMNTLNKIGELIFNA